MEEEQVPAVERSKASVAAAAVAEYQSYLQGEGSNQQAQESTFSTGGVVLHWRFMGAALKSFCTSGGMQQQQKPRRSRSRRIDLSL
jgi:hypothetical protein